MLGKSGKLKPPALHDPNMMLEMQLKMAQRAGASSRDLSVAGADDRHGGADDKRVLAAQQKQLVRQSMLKKASCPPARPPTRAPAPARLPAYRRPACPRRLRPSHMRPWGRRSTRARGLASRWPIRPPRALFSRRSAPHARACARASRAHKGHISLA